MRYLAAYLLLKIAGKDSPTAEEITKVISSVGIECDEDRINSLLSELSGKDINALIAEGSSKLASVPSGGGGVAAAPTSGGAAAPAEAETKEEVKEEKEESDDDMGFGLFD